MPSKRGRDRWTIGMRPLPDSEYASRHEHDNSTFFFSIACVFWAAFGTLLVLGLPIGESAGLIGRENANITNEIGLRRARYAFDWKFRRSMNLTSSLHRPW